MPVVVRERNHLGPTSSTTPWSANTSVPGWSETNGSLYEDGYDEYDHSVLYEPRSELWREPHQVRKLFIQLYPICCSIIGDFSAKNQKIFFRAELLSWRGGGVTYYRPLLFRE